MKTLNEKAQGLRRFLLLIRQRKKEEKPYWHPKKNVGLGATPQPGGHT